MSNVQDEKTVKDALEELFNKGNRKIADQVWGPNYVWHPQDGVSPDMDKQSHLDDITQLRTSFPDLKAKIEDIHSDADKVTTRLTITGTHRGQLKDIASNQVYKPTGKPIRWTAIVIQRMENGKIVEGWINYDYAGVARQIQGP